MRFRQRRVGDQLREHLAQLLMHEVKDPGLGFVTVTEVRMSPDLAHARVYVSVLGDAAQREQSLESLGRAAGYLRTEVGRRMRLRHTPLLNFVADDTLDRSDRIEELLRQNPPSSDADEPPEGDSD